MLSTVALATALAGPAVAQTFPSRPITLIVPFPPGGVTDPVARFVGQKVSDSTGQLVVVENKPGAGGLIGAETVKRAPADGYTLFMGHAGTHAVNQSLYSKLPYDPIKDFAPITLMISTSHILVVPANSPARSVEELVALAKSSPKGLVYASQSIGAGGHLLAEMLRTSTGATFHHVPYKGSAPAIQDILAGRVDMFFDAPITSGPHVREGRMKILASASKQRLRWFPDTPTMAEAGYPGVELDFWFGLFAPAGTPQPVLRRLHEEFAKALRNPEVVKRFTDQGLDVVTNTPEQFAALIAADAARLGKVVRDSGARAD
jgi:tripartite-type tricarboxylate transporter receptor subunit TctC